MRGRHLVVRKDALAKINVIQSRVLYPTSNQDIQEMRQKARAESAEGVMIKHQQSTYTGGRKAGHWWKWKLDPMTADCVLIYAQAVTDAELACIVTIRWRAGTNLVNWFQSQRPTQDLQTPN